jgi:hypothetical protein
MPATATPPAPALPALDHLRNSQVPPDVLARLERFTADLAAAAGPNLASLALFGGVARGRFRPGHSDVNTLIVLESDSAASLAAIAPAVRAAFRAIRLEPMICRRDRLDANARAFPTKFLEIKDTHTLLAGRELLASLTVPRERIAWRAEQELRNMAIRLRRRCTIASKDAPATTAALIEVARPMALALLWVMRLDGRPPIPEDRTAAIFDAASAAYGFNAAALRAVADLRHGTPPPASAPDIESTSESVLQALTLAADRAAALA